MMDNNVSFSWLYVSCFITAFITLVISNWIINDKLKRLIKILILRNVINQKDENWIFDPTK